MALRKSVHKEKDDKKREHRHQSHASLSSLFPSPTPYTHTPQSQWLSVGAPSFFFLLHLDSNGTEQDYQLVDFEITDRWTSSRFLQSKRLSLGQGSSAAKRQSNTKDTGLTQQFFLLRSFDHQLPHGTTEKDKVKTTGNKLHNQLAVATGSATQSTHQEKVVSVFAMQDD